jgi:hypothetical protein
MYLGNFVLKRKFKLVQLADIIINDMNITRNDIVMVYTSFRNINLIDSHPEDLIYLLKMIVGTQGTLLMPTFEENLGSIINSRLPYNKRSTFFRNDSINELFRQMPDTIQSYYTAKSFAAWGKMAKKITEDHNKSELPYYNNDLFFKLSLYKAKIIGIGVSLTDISFGDTLDKESPKRHPEPMEKENIDSTREKFASHYLNTFYDIIKSKSPHEISELFAVDELRVFKKREILFFRADAEKVYNKVISLTKS